MSEQMAYSLWQSFSVGEEGKERDGDGERGGRHKERGGQRKRREIITRGRGGEGDRERQRERQM
jgi:hypothetical protein